MILQSKRILRGIIAVFVLKDGHRAINKQLIKDRLSMVSCLFVQLPA